MVKVVFAILSILGILIVFAIDVVVSRILFRPGAEITAFTQLFTYGSAIPLCALAMVLVGQMEMLHLFRNRGLRPLNGFVTIMVTLLMLSPWLCSAGWLGGRSDQIEGYSWHIVWLGLSVIGGGVLVVLRGLRRPIEQSTQDLGATWIMIIYLGFLPSFAIMLRASRDVSPWDGAWLLLITLLVIKASDMGGYLIGVPFGRHKIAPTISPGKTVEGLIGGLTASVFVAIFLAWLGSSSVMTFFDDLSSRQSVSLLREYFAGLRDFFPEMCGLFGAVTQDGMNPLLRAAIFGLVVGGVGQFGDFLESVFKRDAGVKDSGHVMPRFGGILDLIDSPVLAMPVAWFLLTEVWGLA